MLLLSAPSYKQTGTSRAVSTSVLWVDLQKGFKGTHKFYDKAGRYVAMLVDDELTVFEGFKWDLASPSFRVGRKWFGTPTSEHEVAATLLHDFSRGLLGCPCCPWNRKHTDDFFYDLMELQHSRLTKLYHWFVSNPIGTLYIKLTYRGPQYACQQHV